MRILIINTNPFFYDGISNVIANLYKGIDKEGMQIDFLFVNNPPEGLKSTLLQGNNHIYIVPRTENTVIKYMFSLYRLVKKNKYDLVHIHGNSHTVVVELLPISLAGCKNRFVHAHNTFCKHEKLHKMMTPLFNALCTGNLACGDKAGQFMYGKKQFQVIKNGIDTNKYRFSEEDRAVIRAKLGIENKKVIGHVGTLYNHHKNQSFLLDVLKRLLDIDCSYILVLVGDGQDKETLIEKAKSLNISDNVIFAGTADNVAPILSAMDMVVMPSHYEGLPLSLIEEQANGLSCIVSDVITTEVDVTGNIIFLSLNDSPLKWAERIRDSVVKNPEERTAESQRAIKCIEDSGYGIKSQANILKMLYSQSLK